MPQSTNSVQDLRGRTKLYALRIIRLYTALPKSGAAGVIGKQLLRSGTSVGAHYREACRAKSNADFISKVQGAMQELDESAYWMELLAESGLMKGAKLSPLMTETDELLAVLYSIMRKIQRSKPTRQPE